ncbi:23S rRNA (pseudouridine(1915)-N(3))-methyltransferase RlmH [Nitrosophilus kaiyonis]|uniref:23S rRNA (pseudouridine(1915)-N(3))-methyltransferase RlmH n=1 Tax=Nitrosophilus kaiyonis TaxID=2930200 RepID=UPI002492195F|nr:23S rRNA (pseudouridine(1915)-N(3))-methyltransferase RlmH [Nitrosophilus kaiyonis]
MVKINIYAISKKDEKSYQNIIDDFIKMSKKYAQINIENIFNKKINQAQCKDEKSAKKSYTQSFEPFLKKGFNIVLDPRGKEIDSYEFANILKNLDSVNFFIGGAYGFEEDFIKRSDLCLSLSRLTMSHKIAKIVLLEQIYRAFTIIHSHPYHK